MKRFLTLLTYLVFTATGFARIKDSVHHYPLPDSVKAAGFITDVQTGSVNTKKEFRVGILDAEVKLYIEKSKNESEFVFEYEKSFSLAAKGFDVMAEPGELSWKYNFSDNDVYKLLISTATDSAGNFIIYSGYVFLPKEQKWKLIGTCKITGRWGTIKKPATFFTVLKKNQPIVRFSNIFCQRNNGSWKNMDAVKGAVIPVINLFSHIDSMQQLQTDLRIIESGIASGKTDTKFSLENVFYAITKEGTGKQVTLTDTVVVFYKGYLYNDGTVFDQTKEKPATFPLNRLIKGWQIGLPLIKAGGKIKLIIPSGLAYSIRTRAAKIPPNSILVFEIEVIDAKELK